MCNPIKVLNSASQSSVTLSRFEPALIPPSVLVDDGYNRCRYRYSTYQYQVLYFVLLYRSTRYQHVLSYMILLNISTHTGTRKTGAPSFGTIAHSCQVRALSDGPFRLLPPVKTTVSSLAVVGCFIQTVIGNFALLSRDRPANSYSSITS